MIQQEISLSCPSISTLHHRSFQPSAISRWPGGRFLKTRAGRRCAAGDRSTADVLHPDKGPAVLPLSGVNRGWQKQSSAIAPAITESDISCQARAVDCICPDMLGIMTFQAECGIDSTVITKKPRKKTDGESDSLGNSRRNRCYQPAGESIR